jgi:para-aminobenzoate synthetase component 1
VVLTNALMGAVPVNHVNGVPVVQEPGVCDMINHALAQAL